MLLRLCILSYAFSSSSCQTCVFYSTVYSQDKDYFIYSGNFACCFTFSVTSNEAQNCVVNGFSDRVPHLKK